MYKSSEPTKAIQTFQTSEGPTDTGSQPAWKPSFKLKLRRTVVDLHSLNLEVPSETDDAKTSSKNGSFLKSSNPRPLFRLNQDRSSLRRSTHDINLQQHCSDTRELKALASLRSISKRCTPSSQLLPTPTNEASIGTSKGPRARSVSIEPKLGDNGGNIRSGTDPPAGFSPASRVALALHAATGETTQPTPMLQINFSSLLDNLDKLRTNMRRSYLRDGVVCEKVLLVWESGSMYEGELRSLKFHGKGKLYHSSGYSIKGDFEQGLVTGSAEYSSCKSTYKGDWLANLPHGSGTETVEGKYSFTGSFSCGVKQGHGTMKVFGKGTYTGDFYRNCFHGLGKFEWDDGGVYSGSWFLNQMHGKGSMAWPDGRRFVGRYVRNKKEGYGVFSWADGRVYSGNWKDGRQNGFGKYVSLQGRTVAGEWDEGEALFLPC